MCGSTQQSSAERRRRFILPYSSAIVTADRLGVAVNAFAVPITSGVFALEMRALVYVELLDGLVEGRVTDRVRQLSALTRRSISSAAVRGYFMRRRTWE